MKTEGLGALLTSSGVRETYVEEGAGPSRSPFRGSPAHRLELIESIREIGTIEAIREIYGLDMETGESMDELWEAIRVPPELIDFADYAGGKETASEMIEMIPISTDILDRHSNTRALEAGLSKAFLALADDTIFDQAIEEVFGEGATESIGIGSVISFENKRRSASEAEVNRILEGMKLKNKTGLSLRFSVESALEGNRVRALDNLLMAIEDRPEKQQDEVKRRISERLLREHAAWVRTLTPVG